MKNILIGQTASGLPIPGFHFGHSGANVLVLGGVHGDEREGVEAAWGLWNKWLKAFPFHLNLVLIPALNMDGVMNKARVNSRGVDLNRNMATRDWSAKVTTPRYNPGPYPNSEPETQALIQIIQNLKPELILSLHSWNPVLNVNGDCLNVARAISAQTGYAIEDSIGYPTPGCLGTYCGLERNQPTLTYEIERGLKTEQILSVHLLAIEEGLKVVEHRS